MKRHTTPGAGDELLSEMVKLVQTTFSETSARQDGRGLARLERACHVWGWTGKGATIQNGRFRVLVAALATASVVGGWLFVQGQAGDVTYEVLNGTIDPAGFVRSNAHGTKILFSEGSEIALDESARTRVDGMTADGGRVVVESGSVHAQIVHRKRSRWSVQAGPYSILVTGTAFNVNWSWTSELLDIRIDRGSVVVTGPLAPSGVTLTAGMRLRVNPRSGLDIGDAATSKRAGSLDTSASRSAPTVEPPSEAGPSEAATGDRAGQAPPGEGANPAASLASRTDAESGPGQRFGAGLRRKVASSQGFGRRAATSGGALGSVDLWERQLARGDVQGILDDAEARGIDGILGSASRRDLSALADAARYGHRPHLARRALASMRDRFSGSPEARDAAFFLGGLADDTAGSAGQAGALEWYERYLGESFQGRYAAQALGRKMVIAQKLKGSEAARVIAEEYLRRFPEGPYVAAARKLTRSP
jgi:hypothetical protein